MSSERVFLHANILFSIAYGSPGLERLWSDAKKGKYELIASQYVIEEAKRNLEEKFALFHINQDRTDRAMDKIVDHCRRVARESNSQVGILGACCDMTFQL